MPDTVSIVIPTYNPERRILARTLSAVRSLEVPEGVEVDYVIVDNNSDPPIGQMSCVREFVASSVARLVQEPAQGLTFARLAGIRATSGSVVVVFDDDNVPGRDYLQVVVRCMKALPWVGVWGPGRIDVELLDPVPASLQPRARTIHNERRHRFVSYGSVPASWQEYYPIGMGQVIRREVADQYRRAVEAGELSSTDRKGGCLTSGGDTQIVWQAINMGLAAGVHPGLRMTHLIPGRRATLHYMRRLAFGCGLSYHPSMVQSFPGELKRLPPALGALADGIQLLRFVLGNVSHGRVRFLSLDFANRLGLICGRLMAAGLAPTHWSFRLAKKLRLT
jgi:hypothetical protein